LVRIHFKREGGLAYFPGLSKPVTIDANQLPKEEEQELERLLESAGFFDLPTAPPPQRGGAADAFQYTITVESGGKQHTVRVSDPVENPDLQKLIDFIQTKAKSPRT
jgi:hypothetical protein